jgi:cytochrome P450
VKRVIGVPGDTLQMKDGVVFRNGKQLNEPYVQRRPSRRAAGAGRQPGDAAHDPRATATTTAPRPGLRGRGAATAPRATTGARWWCRGALLHDGRQPRPVAGLALHGLHPARGDARQAAVHLLQRTTRKPTRPSRTSLTVGALGPHRHRIHACCDAPTEAGRSDEHPGRRERGRPPPGAFRSPSRPGRARACRLAHAAGLPARPAPLRSTACAATGATWSASASGRGTCTSSAHPDMVRDVLVTHHRNFIKSLALQRARVLLGTGLLTSEGEFHLRQRRLAQPAFHRERIAALGETMVAYAGRAGGRLARGRGAGRAAGDEPPDAGHRREDAVRRRRGGRGGRDRPRAERRAQPVPRPHQPARPVILDKLPVPGTLRMKRASRAAGRHHLPDDRASAALSGEDRGRPARHAAGRARRRGRRRGMTDLQLRDEALTLFLAGHETTANALAWTWHLLALNPDAEARLHAEADAVLGGGSAARGRPAALRYTRAGARRVDAAVPARVDDRPRAAGGLRRPAATASRAGGVVLMSPWLTHRDARWWPTPERFDPGPVDAGARGARSRATPTSRSAAGRASASARGSRGWRGSWCSPPSPALAPAPRPRRPRGARTPHHPAPHRPADASRAPVVTLHDNRSSSRGDADVSSSFLRVLRVSA